MRRIVILLVAACASHPPKTGSGTGTGTGSASVAPAPDAAPATAKAEPITADQCSTTIDHIFDLTLADKKAKEPDKEWHDDKVAAARQSLHDALAPKCSTIDRASYDCFMAATSMDQANA